MKRYITTTLVALGLSLIGFSLCASCTAYKWQRKNTTPANKKLVTMTSASLKVEKTKRRDNTFIAAKKSKSFIGFKQNSPDTKVNKRETVLAKTRHAARAANDVRNTGQVTAEQLNKHFAKYKNGRLQGKGQVFIDMEKKYGISAKFMAAIATQESGAGTSSRARTRNDCFGMTGFGKKKTWASIDANIESAYSLIDRVYIKKFKVTTVPSIGKKYCVGGNWAAKVQGIMNRI